jgi:hypothetical protein
VGGWGGDRQTDRQTRDFFLLLLFGSFAMPVQY